MPILAAAALAWGAPSEAFAQSASLTVAAGPQPPVAVAATPQAPAPSPAFSQDVAVFGHALGLRGSRFDDFVVDADLVGVGALYGAGFDFRRLCRLDLRVGGGRFASIAGRALHLGSKAPLVDLESPTFVTFQAALGTELPAGPIEVTVEARFSADWLESDLHGRDGLTGASVDAWVFEGGIGVGARYALAKDLWIGPSYYGGIAGNEHIGYAHGGKLTLTADLL